MREFDIHIHTNTDCNLRCKHCYNNSGMCEKVWMPQEKILEYLDFFNSFYKSDIHLEGGEIFLRPKLLSAMNQLENGILKNITITTNGTIRNENQSVIDMLRKIRSLRISIEGHTQEIHRAVRDSDLKQVLENALFYQRQGIDVTLRLTLHAFNRDTLFTEGIPYLETWGFARFQVYEFQYVGRGINSGLAVEDDFKQILKHYADMENMGEVKFMLAERRLESIRKQEQMLRDRNVEVDYYETGNSLSIKANGNMTVCPWDEENVIANIAELTEAQFMNLLSQDIYVHQCEACSKASLRKAHV